MDRFNRISALFLLLLAPLLAAAQEKQARLNIRGTVYENQTLQPLEGASVKLLNERDSMIAGVMTKQNGQFLLPAYDYGYADNQPNLIDYEDPNTDGCGMDIGWAIDHDGQPVDLDHIDFVRVYNAMNQTCGWIGETSTEITGAEDLHLEASLAWAAGIVAPAAAATQHAGCIYDLQGRKVSVADMKKGVYFINGKKDKLFHPVGVQKAYDYMHGVWDGQGVGQRLKTELWDMPHWCGPEVQAAVKKFLDENL